MKKIIIIGGGTINYVRAHLAISAPAYGGTARKIHDILNKKNIVNELFLTKMADFNSKIETNDDVLIWVNRILEDKNVGAIIFNAALADFTGQIGDEASGKYAERLRTVNGDNFIKITPSNKIISEIKDKRPDIIVTGFKTTSGADLNTQRERGLNLLTSNNIDYVIANDLVTRKNLLIPRSDFILDDRDIVIDKLLNYIYGDLCKKNILKI